MNDPALTLTIPPAFLEQVAQRAAEINRAHFAATLEATTPWLDTREAAEYLRIPLGTFREQVTAGRWPVHSEGRRNYFDRAELDRARRGDQAGRVRRAA